MKAELVPAERWHVDVIAAAARPADVAELWACGRTTPADAMERGLAGSVCAYSALINDVPVCMFGAVPYSILGGIGTPWMIGSTGLNPLAAQKELLRLSVPVVDDMQRQFPEMLFNVVDERNKAAQRWLRWLGFTLVDPIPVGPDAMPFRPFYRRKSDV